MRRLAFVVLLVLAVPVACGQDAPDMSPAAETRLQTEVAAVRDAVEAGDDAGATAQLASLRTTVVELVGTNGITADRAIEINGAIARLERELAARASATTTTAAPVTSVAVVTTTTAATTTTSTTTPPTTTSTEGPPTPGEGPPKGPGKDKDKKKPKAGDD
jgi:hypothetical protein